MRLKTEIAFLFIFGMFSLSFCFILGKIDNKNNIANCKIDLKENYEKKAKFSYEMDNKVELNIDDFSLSEDYDIISYSNRFVNEVNNELECYGTSIKNELNKKKKLYEKNYKN